MKKGTSNIIALKSKKWIMDSLLALMNEKEFNNITITEIIKRADLTRQTFYRHFTSKEDVLHAYISEIYNNCFEKVNTLEEKTLFNVLVTYFTYWENNKDLLLLADKCNLNYNIMDFYYKYMDNALDMITDKVVSKNENEINYVKNFILGGFINVKMIWMKNNFKEGPQELAQTIINLLNPYISS